MMIILIESHPPNLASIVNNPQASHVTIKIENGKGWNGELSNEADVLKELDGHVCFPRFLGEGTSQMNSYLVMELLDDNLRTIIAHSVNNRLPVALQQHYALSTLSCIESLHELGWMHNNISPEHFVRRNNGSAENELVLISFSHATRLNNATPSFPTQTSAKCGKHCAYVSLNCHRGEKESWRDDLWSWFFIVLEMNVGRLPWSYTDTWEESFAKKIGWERGMKQLLETNPLSSTSVSIAVPINPSSSDAGTFSHFSSASSPNNKNATVSGTEPFCTPQHSTRMPQTPSIFVTLFKLLSDLRFGEKVDFNEIRRILHLSPEESENRSKFPCPSPTENRTWSPASHSPSLVFYGQDQDDINGSLSHHIFLPARNRTTEWMELEKSRTANGASPQLPSPSQSELSPHSLSISFDYNSPFEIPSLLLSQIHFQNPNSQFFQTPSSSLLTFGLGVRGVQEKRDDHPESARWSHSFTLSSDDDDFTPTTTQSQNYRTQRASNSSQPHSHSVEDAPENAPTPLYLHVDTLWSQSSSPPQSSGPPTTMKPEPFESEWRLEGEWNNDNTELPHQAGRKVEQQFRVLFVPDPVVDVRNTPSEPDSAISTTSAVSGAETGKHSFEKEWRDLDRTSWTSPHSSDHITLPITLANKSPLHCSVLVALTSLSFTPFFASATSSHPRDPPSTLPASSEVSAAMNSHTAEYLLFDVTRLSLPPTSDAAEGRIGVGTHSSSVPNYFRVVSDILSPSSPFHALPQPSDPTHVSPSLFSSLPFLVRLWTLVSFAFRYRVFFASLQAALTDLIARERSTDLSGNASFRVDLSLNKNLLHSFLSISGSSLHLSSSSYSASSQCCTKDDSLLSSVPTLSPLGFSSELARRDSAFETSSASSFCYLPSLSLADQLTSVTSLMGEESVDLTSRQIGELLSQRRRKTRDRRDRGRMNSSSLSHLSAKHRSMLSAGSSQILYDLSDSNPTLSIGDPFQSHLDMSVVFRSFADSKLGNRRTQLLITPEISVVKGPGSSSHHERATSMVIPPTGLGPLDVTEHGTVEEGRVLGENNAEEKRTVVDGLTRSFSSPHLSAPFSPHFGHTHDVMKRRSFEQAITQPQPSDPPKHDDYESDDDATDIVSLGSVETEEEIIFQASPTQSTFSVFTPPTLNNRQDENGRFGEKNTLSISLLHSTFPHPSVPSLSFQDSPTNNYLHSPSKLLSGDTTLLFHKRRSFPQSESQKSFCLDRISLCDQLSETNADHSPFSTRSASQLQPFTSRHVMGAPAFGLTTKGEKHAEVLEKDSESPRLVHELLFIRAVSPPPAELDVRSEVDRVHSHEEVSVRAYCFK
ncbi:putative Tau-tubulin kinase 1 [Blattamonas nauphoetae]|uniref:Tau-tubulin kinase 1 n=1 Tax=Blattamonas nauphoetae TaxID=2049346 RepID=A0ABQ9XSP9_9EUKA|nr:putative Tau-tubulin kinase 1 [Blattamonas nauphoetae]